MPKAKFYVSHRHNSRYFDAFWILLFTICKNIHSINLNLVLRKVYHKSQTSAQYIDMLISGQSGA